MENVAHVTGVIEEIKTLIDVLIRGEKNIDEVRGLIELSEKLPNQLKNLLNAKVDSLAVDKLLLTESKALLETQQLDRAFEKLFSKSFLSSADLKTLENEIKVLESKSLTVTKFDEIVKKNKLPASVNEKKLTTILKYSVGSVLGTMSLYEIIRLYQLEITGCICYNNITKTECQVYGEAKTNNRNVWIPDCDVNNILPAQKELKEKNENYRDVIKKNPCTFCNAEFLKTQDKRFFETFTYTCSSPNFFDALESLADRTITRSVSGVSNIIAKIFSIINFVLDYSVPVILIFLAYFILKPVIMILQSRNLVDKKDS